MVFASARGAPPCIDPILRRTASTNIAPLLCMWQISASVTCYVCPLAVYTERTCFPLRRPSSVQHNLLAKQLHGTVRFTQYITHPQKSGLVDGDRDDKTSLGTVRHSPVPRAAGSLVLP